MVSIESEVAIITADLEVVLGGTDHNLSWSSAHSLVAVMLQADLTPPFSCLVGKCGACLCTLVEGQVSMDHNEVLDDGDIAEGYVLGCQAKPLTPNVKITFD
ncbi:MULTISPECIES: 2Fe-2S iron-sulfur cluster-binding protein [unclassified Sphingobium]|uniref:2Fe-2S iron-sulfur cluster-binding protein n=1 Tax=unclassified Sphingobium TaxID=2611147 RepID=UPI00077054CE|nr:MULTISPECIES: 2Fe-2S iron-sulfur cluster binding domain-containing protein [Sphingomonadaceae]AMK24130.1 ferredoxin domain oxidoreductase [Sphingobium sp. TKS]NML91980.1 2Fe-2S iron-sulfur cluster binding domain-containing protein [Sphingobium sp. TB-6]